MGFSFQVESRCSINLLGINPLSANLTKWSNTLKQFVSKLAPNCLNVFDHFAKLALKGLKGYQRIKWRNMTGVIFQLGLRLCFFFSFFFYLGFPSQPFTNHRAAGKGGRHFFNPSLPLPPASHTLRHQPGNYCRELTSAHRQHPDSNREPLVSEPKSLTNNLAFLHIFRELVICIK